MKNANSPEDAVSIAAILLCGLICTPVLAQATTVINVPGDPPPESVGAGTTLDVSAGGVIPSRFEARPGSIVNVRDGAEFQGDFRAIDAHVDISGGAFAGTISALDGSDLRLSGGLYDGVISLQSGSRGLVTGGSHTPVLGVLGKWNVDANSELHLVASELSFRRSNNNISTLAPIGGLDSPGDSVDLSGTVCTENPDPDAVAGITIEFLCTHPLQGRLLDRSPIDFPGRGWGGFIHPDATLRVTLGFPEGYCDLNEDEACDLGDIEVLLARVGSDDSHVDFDYDGIVNGDDVQTWLTNAGNKEHTGPYLLGDTNLDGQVDTIDLNSLALNWQIRNNVGWSDGDFNGDGWVAAEDLNALASNWRQPSPVTPVPEPCALLTASLALLATSKIRRYHAKARVNSCFRASFFQLSRRHSGTGIPLPSHNQD